MTALERLDPERQAHVRQQVRALLDRSDSFSTLDPTERKKVARGLVETVAFLADPAAGTQDLSGLSRAEEQAAREGLAETLADTSQQKDASNLRKRVTKDDPGFAGKDFKGGALEAGVDAFRQMVDSVDFPQFVSGLIEGVFTSIVDSSIRQMQAYGELLSAVVQSVEQFAQDNVSLNQARDYAAGKFPSLLKVEVSNGNPSLKLNDDADEEQLSQVKEAFGLEDDVDLDDEVSEAELARRAQLEMARMRQQQLATMVLLGINRIVVTDGLINAKVVFDMRASDVAARTNTASMHDREDTRRQFGDSGGWFSNDYDHTNSRHTTTVASSLTDESESKAEVKARLTGEVKVNFKSETFPLDRMATGNEQEAVQKRAAK